ncbi:unnamed protein product [Notodromas monacha]|uniref:R3H domain-containing protein n=1 Tax=Notodromas monacha TaxID=399045 RepID=A0A7R9BEZ6_9CRUS|nr:unnamed protein product [Notodromas monacha]CAG0913268.1 unnamed protein product [Notodromas monacha]
MDLLGSILSTMDRPPPVSEKDKRVRKEHEAQVKKALDEERDRLKSLKNGIDEIIDDFLQNANQTRLKLEPMEKIARKIVHEAAENVGLIAHTFPSEEGSEPHVMLFKKEDAPCDGELSCIRSGRPWNPAAAAKLRGSADTYEIPEPLRRNKSKDTELDGYRKKYERIVGSELSASKVTVTKNHYGFVPTENKKDIRSIEQTLADIRARRKRKAESSSSTETPAS